jgi:hypothetical protein
MRLQKTVREILRAHAGWRVGGMTGTGHYKLMGPRGEIIYCASSPSDRRAPKKVRAQLRRAEREAAP